MQRSDVRTVAVSECVSASVCVRVCVCVYAYMRMCVCVWYTMDESQQMEARILALKLRRIEQLNHKLRENLAQERIPASRAAALIIHTAEHTPDPLVPSLWTVLAEQNRYRMHREMSSRVPASGCCTIV